jgi:hypothetical protein
MLIDFGPDEDETWTVLRERLTSLVPDKNGRRHIDLAIVSHIDHDHIGGASLLFSDDDLGLSFGDVWFNARHHLERGVAEGQALSELLGGQKRKIPWNVAFGGGPVVTPKDGGFVELPALRGHPRLTLLSPTPKQLVRLATVWDTELEKLRKRESNTEADLDRGGGFPDLEVLAARPSPRDHSPTNGSSIAVLLEHQGNSVLLAADAFPTVLGSALLNLAKHRQAQLPLRVDVFKLSHHGSRANLMTEVLGAVTADHYVVSTNNARYGHPNDEALARTVLYGGEHPTLWFNYATTQNRRWADEQLQSCYGFATRFPGDSERGVSLRLFG